jgi:hypothetical protein
LNRSDACPAAETILPEDFFSDSTCGDNTNSRDDDFVHNLMKKTEKEKRAKSEKEKKSRRSLCFE